jgi:PilZ domain
MECWEYVTGRLPRAPRFALPLYARYCVDHGDGWHDATIVNISRSGALFNTAHVIAAGTGTLGGLTIVVSRDALAAMAVSIRCRCRIVRIERATDTRSGIHVAAAILSTVFQRIDQPRANQ